MLVEVKNKNYHWFEDEQGRMQGEYKSWRDNGNLASHGFFTNDRATGEFKWHDYDGTLQNHYFFVNGNPVSFDEIPYPDTPEDRMLFVLRHGIPLLPVETTC